MRTVDSEEDIDPGIATRRRRLWIGLGALLVLALGAVAVKAISGAKGSSGPARPPAPVLVALPPPPPPPPTPPPVVTPPPAESKMVEQEKVNEDEPKPEPKLAEAPAPATGIRGPGPSDGFGLGGSGGTRLGGGGGGGGGSKWGWYAGQVQGRVAGALRAHPKTRNGRWENLVVRVWADSAGRVSRVALAGSTGDPAADAAIRSEILGGLQLQEPPPAGMPMPIVLRIQARRPN